MIEGLQIFMGLLGLSCAAHVLLLIREHVSIVLAVERVEELDVLGRTDSSEQDGLPTLQGKAALSRWAGRLSP